MCLHCGCSGAACSSALPALLALRPTADCATWPPCHLQADKGDLLPTNLGGFGATTTGGSGGAAAAGGGLATAGSVGPPTKIKLKVGGKKDKKVRRLFVFCTQAGAAIGGCDLLVAG